MVEFTVTRDETTVEDAVYDVAPLVDTANPFGDYAVVKIDDRGGTKFDDYERGTRIDIEITDEGGTTFDRFTGYVVERRELDQQGADALEVEAYSFDQFLRRNTVTNDQRERTLTAALRDIITTDTPITYVGPDSDSGAVANATTTEYAKETTGDAEAQISVDLFDGESATVTVDILNDGGVIASDTESGTAPSGGSLTLMASTAVGDTDFDEIRFTHSGDNTAEWSWDISDTEQITIVDTQTLTRSYQGVPVEDVLRDFAFKSGNETFGVDDDLEFFFRPRETQHIDRGVDNTEWFNYDIPELGKEAINEVEVWFNDGDESVIVDDPTDKLDLQETLSLPEPGTQRQELQRPLITDIGDAEDIGRKYLAFRNATLSGTVTTFGLFNAEPGDTINVTIDPRGIDTEFVIAAVEYRWGVDQTILTVVEKRGDVDDILADLSDSVQRVEMEGANRDAPKNRITTTLARAVVTPSWDVDGSTPDARRFVNDARNAVRDGWTGATPPNISQIQVGDDGSGLSRSNTGLKNQTNSASVSASLVDATTIRYEATITQTGVEEVGLVTSDGTLISRAVFDSPADIDGTVSVDLSVSNDDSVSRGVLTAGGQTAVRDIIADNSPTLPDEYAYGADGAAVAESDTALGNEVTRVSLNEITVQSADTTSAWESITDIPDDAPIRVANGRLELLQSAFTTESDQLTRSATALQQDNNYSNDEAERIDNVNEFLELTFEVEYTIPESAVGVWVRFTTGGVGNTASGPGLEFELNDDLWKPVSNAAGAQGLIWRDLANDPFGTSEIYRGGDLTPGTYTLTIRGDSTGDGQDIDVVAPLDNRRTVTFDSDTTGAGERVSGPELFPEQVVQSLATAPTRRLVSEARFTSSWTDTSGDQHIEVANDGTTFQRFTNTDSDTVTFGEEDAGLDTNLALSRYGSDTTRTPTTGFNGQAVDSWQLFATVEAVKSDDIGAALTRAIVPPNTITGETIREAGIFGDGSLLTRHELAAFDVLAEQRLGSSETTRVIGPSD